ncbi:transposase [Propionibacterium australiense]|uniref:Transposase, mutator type n=1 Tax=Propionibacterium australiense TaxID=119981 RepID=A0A383S5F0_9ACTN|nr:transposase [Propionibacterium australiense]SYZ32951.1 Transposase, mutator type [Propionibacterium australiense]VEH92367.1 Uncharacterised protein [Propionibacterium australiense]
MSESTTEATEGLVDPVTGEIVDQKQLAERLLARAREQGVSLVGPGGLLNQLTKNMLETALEAELTEHLGHEHGETPIAVNMGNGRRPKTVLTEIGPVQRPQRLSGPVSCRYPAEGLDIMTMGAESMVTVPVTRYPKAS